MAQNNNNDIITRYAAHARELAKDDTFTSAAINTEPGIRIRSEYNRRVFEKYRPGQTIPEPTNQVNCQKIMRMCTSAYDRVGVIRSVIDMMSEFAADGVEIVHEDEKPNAFYQAWQKKIKLQDRVERGLNWLYKAGQFVVTRQMAKLDMPGISGAKVPIGYTFYDPSTIDLIGEYIGTLSSVKKFGIRIPIANLNLKNPKNDLEKQVYNGLPLEVRKAIEGKGLSTSQVLLVPIPEDKIYVGYYKKDDSQIWATSFIYSILGDIFYNDSLKMAKISSLDGWNNKINLWKLGNIEAGILPTPAMAAKLANVIGQNTGGGSIDIIWDNGIELEQFYPPIEKLQNFEEDIDAILMGLGVSKSLVGGDGGDGNMPDKYLSLKNLIKRLETGRREARYWLEAEIDIIQKEMGFRKRPIIRFSNEDLYDDQTYFAILKDLVDRDIISDSRVLEILNESPELERSSIKREYELRKNGELPPKASPFHKPDGDIQRAHEIKKIKVQSEVKPPAGSPNAPKPKINTRPGRPKNSRDTVTRKRSPNKFKGSKSKLIEATRIYDFVDNNLTNLALATYNVSDVRKLTSEQKNELEKAKMAAMASIAPFSELNDDIFITNGSKEKEINEYFNIYNDLVANEGSDKLSYDQKRLLKITAYIKLYNRV